MVVILFCADFPEIRHSACSTSCTIAFIASSATDDSATKIVFNSCW